MEKTIASMYEITRELGSGGSGIVYLGYHKHLNKPIVLKADKRSLSSSSSRLRQEVDMLKDLHHTYLPQVYDFVQEDGVVYTVMDYIEGESLDRPLKRGEKFEQNQVVEWACELLEALCYLHSRPPHGILHADIKPANIMLTDQNEIRLIDFNIALALGEDGAIRMGYSAGYASPEHYGLDYTRSKQRNENSDDTEKLEKEGETVGLSGSGSSYGRGVLLDVRSDIYSLGATLYHFLTGERPDADARRVRPISGWNHISLPVAQIIEKAMNPNPDLRYQTAEEMLRAFERLHENDPRAKKHRRRAVTAALVSILIFLTGGAVTFIGQTQMRRMSEAGTLAEYSANALRRGDVEQAVSYALEALPEHPSLLDPPYSPPAQRALANALGVYDLSDGYKAHLSINLPSEPIKAKLSPDGTKTAVLLRAGNDWKIQIYDTETGRKAADLPAEASALSEFVFVNDETIIYAGLGTLSACDLSENSIIWETGVPATGIAVSADGSIVAAVNRDDSQGRIYSANTGEFLKTVDFQGRHQDIFLESDTGLFTNINLLSLDASGEWLAVSFVGGDVCLYNLRQDGVMITLLRESGYTSFNGGFFGSCFALSATGKTECALVAFDLITDEFLVAAANPTPYILQIDETGIYLANENTLVELDPYTLSQRELAHVAENIRIFNHTGNLAAVVVGDNACTLYSEDARVMQVFPSEPRIDTANIAGDFLLLASRDTRELVLWKRLSYPEAQMFYYDPATKHVEARVQSDESSAMLFQFDRFVILNHEGPLISDNSVADAEQPYDLRYLRNPEGDVLEVTYDSGIIRTYSARNGEILFEEQGPPPDGTLAEEFYTETYHIMDPHYGMPVVYDKLSGKALKTLEQDANLRWAEERNGCLILSLMTADGVGSGQILDENFEIIADLPNLCDVLPDGTLVFDDTFGNLRHSRFYTVQELIALAKQQMEVTQ